MSRNYSDKVERAAKEVWVVMHREASNRGMALTRDKRYGDGRIIIGTIGSFIKMLNKEREWGLTETEIDLTRRYLRATGNVVVLSKMEQYRFRIFVREQWSDERISEERTEGDAISKRAARLSPEEAGETMEPSPVKYKCGVCQAEFVNYHALNGHKASHATKEKVKRRGKVKEKSEPVTVLGEKTAMVLRALKDLGGEVKDETGFVARKLAKEAGVEMPIANAFATLVGRGLIDREGNATRTYRVTLTSEGWKASRNVNHYRSSQEVVHEAMRRAQVVTTTRGQDNLYERLGSMCGISPERAASGARTLEDAGVVDIERENGQPKRVALVDATDTSEEEESVPNFATPQPMVTETSDVPDEELIAEVLTRLKQRDDSSLEAKMEIIASLVDDATQGKISPLKALSDIQETVNL